MLNAMTVDVEDYFQVSAFSKKISSSDWDGFPLRVEQNTYRLLDLFDEQDIKVTFFVLGWVAERVPGLLRTIAARGHEVGCHGYSHQLVYRQSPELFRQETVRAKSLIEDQVQKPIQSYRAASYSVTDRSLWALDILVELGFVYDSSIFPTRHDLYGIPTSPRWPYRLVTANGGSIIEFPPSTMSIFGYHLPVAGGGYFRLYPYAFSRFALAHVNRVERQPFMFYVHPWEVDPSQPKIKAGLFSSFRHYNNLSRCEERLRRLITQFRFAPITDVVKSISLPAINWSALETSS